MSQPVLVAGSNTTWWMQAGRAVAVIVMLAGGFLYFQQATGALLISIVGGVLFIANEIYIFYRARGRRWVEDTGNGFEITDCNGLREVVDEQVTAFSFLTEDKYREGVLKAVVRKFLVWVEGDPTPIVMTNKIPAGHVDPLAALIERLMEKLKQQGQRALAGGSRVTGQGWTLRQSSLSIDRGTVEELPIDQIEAIDVFGSEICIWRRGEETAGIRIPHSTRNAHLLYMILQPRLAERDEKSPPKPPAEGLGRILFARNSRAAGITLSVISIPFAIAGIALFFAPDAWFVGPILIGLSALLGLAALGLMRSSFRCHEYGVYRSGMMSENSLRYIDVGSFTYTAVRQYYNGVYTGTNFRFTFTPLAESGAKAIVYNNQRKNDDDEMDMLRDHISGVIAARMGETLAAGQSVAWTPNMTFHPDGIEHLPAGWFGRKDPIKIPYDQVRGFDVQEGNFYLWNHTSDKPIVQEPMSQPNFFPGFFLLASMFSEDEDQEGEKTKQQTA